MEFLINNLYGHRFTSLYFLVELVGFRVGAKKGKPTAVEVPKSVARDVDPAVVDDEMSLVSFTSCSLWISISDSRLAISLITSAGASDWIIL